MTKSSLSALEVKERLKLVLITMAVPEALIQWDSKLQDIGIDSQQTIDLIIRIEDEFGVSFPDSMLNSSVLGTLVSVTRALEALLEVRS